MFKGILKTLSLVALASALVSGCGPFWVDPYIDVEESQLNWVEIHYYNLNRKPTRRVSVYLSGMGHVEIKRGASGLVSDDFAKKYKDEDWSNIRTQRVNIDPKHLNDIFQNLVNHGLLDCEKFGRGSGKGKDEHKRFIAVKANINNYTFNEQQNIFETDPDLAEQLLDVVREFENPAL